MIWLEPSIAALFVTALSWLARRRAARTRGLPRWERPDAPSMRETLERRVREGNLPL